MWQVVKECSFRNWEWGSSACTSFTVWYARFTGSACTSMCAYSRIFTARENAKRLIFLLLFICFAQIILGWYWSEKYSSAHEFRLKNTKFYCINESLCNNPVPPKFTRVYLQPGPHQRAAAPNDTDSVVRGGNSGQGTRRQGRVPQTVKLINFAFIMSPPRQHSFIAQAVIFL